MQEGYERREGVHRAYSAAAERPRDHHPFPVGRNFAESLDYPPQLLAQLPEVAVEAFAGVSNVSIYARIPPDATTLDLGCGAGLDTLVAARRVGPGGRVMGVDFSAAMLSRAVEAAAEGKLTNVLFAQTSAEFMPIPDGSVDVALVNGIFNLNPERTAIFQELARVMRKGGDVFAAELILRMRLPKSLRRGDDDWFA